MNRLSLLTPYDLQQQLAQHIKDQRKALKWSRDELAKRSTVPASTLKKFETTGQISFRQFLLLWMCVDDLGRLEQLLKPNDVEPVFHSIEDVFKS